MGINNANATAMCSTQRWVVTVLALSLIAYIFISFRSMQFHLDLPSPPAQILINEQRHQKSPRMKHPRIRFFFTRPRFLTELMLKWRKSSRFTFIPMAIRKLFFFNQTPRKLTGKYVSEGYFFQNIRESRFRTDNPEEAHLFFIPISCHKMRENVSI